ncbi:MAG: hypothetical protein ACOYXB_06455 [Bacteroidota bacterium]
MFKSSSSTNIYKYLYPAMTLALMVYFIYVFGNKAGELSLEYMVATIFLFVWIFVFSLQMPFRLKSIEADDSGVHILNKDGKKTIEYGDILWISKFDLSSPSLITIRYKDRSTGLEKKLGYLPDRKTRAMMGDDELTGFIKNKVLLLNPELEDSMKKIQRNKYLAFITLSIIFIAIFYLLISGRIHIS